MRLKKDMENAVIFGVCAGIAKEYGLDITLVRIAFVATSLFFGSAILIYLVLALVMPKD